MNGEGRYYFATDHLNTYEGVFKDDKMNGRGKVYNTLGSCEGEFLDNNMVGEAFVGIGNGSFNFGIIVKD